MDNIFILSNSPGEVSGWVKPTAAALASCGLGAKTTLVLLPCPYASGMEERYGREIYGIDDAVPFKSAWKSNISGSGKRLVLQLGGD
ncbi:MAG: cdisaccharide synthetase, partial [Synergistaceae bacterium]